MGATMHFHSLLHKQKFKRSHPYIQHGTTKLAWTPAFDQKKKSFVYICMHGDCCWHFVRYALLLTRSCPIGIGCKPVLNCMAYDNIKDFQNHTIRLQPTWSTWIAQVCQLHVWQKSFRLTMFKYNIEHVFYRFLHFNYGPQKWVFNICSS